jgi:hypothetical protein
LVDKTSEPFPKGKGEQKEKMMSKVDEYWDGYWFRIDKWKKDAEEESKKLREKEGETMKVSKLRVKSHKVEVVWAEEVVYQIVETAKKNGWVCSIDDVNDDLYNDPCWTWGDAVMTLIDAEVFVKSVMEALNNTCTCEGKFFTVDFKFQLVALEG